MKVSNQKAQIQAEKEELEKLLKTLTTLYSLDRHHYGNVDLLHRIYVMCHSLSQKYETEITFD